MRLVTVERNGDCYAEVKADNGTTLFAIRLKGTDDSPILDVHAVSDHRNYLAWVNVRPVSGNRIEVRQQV